MKRRRDDFGNGIFIFVFVLIVAFCYGWIANLISLIYSDSLNGLVIARAIGVIVAPLGAALGYF